MTEIGVIVIGTVVIVVVIGCLNNLTLIRSERCSSVTL